MAKYKLIAEKIVENGIKKLKCPFCSYTWVPRKKFPRQCPMCKRYIYVIVKRGD